MRYYVTIDGVEVELDLEMTPDGRYVVRRPGEQNGAHAIEVTRADAHSGTLLIDGRVLEAALTGTSTDPELQIGGERYALKVESARVRDAHGRNNANAGASDSLIVAPMPGKVVKVLVTTGDEVSAGQALIVIEAMKMENELFSPRAGRIAEVLVSAGGAVERGAPLIRIDPA